MEMDVYSDLNQAAFVTAFCTKKVASELVANTSQMQDLTSQFASLGLVLSGIETVVPQAANGEV